MNTNTITIFFALLLLHQVVLHSPINQCFNVPLMEFHDGEQHCDCNYIVPPGETDVPPEQVAIDTFWINLVHQYAITTNPGSPFGAAIVDTRNNSLLCLSVNERQSNNPTYGLWWGHAEMVVMQNCTNLHLPDVLNAAGKKENNPNWQFMVLYGNIEACPMCAQSAIWRGDGGMVFGARAKVLAEQRCWTQSNLTAKEMVDQSASFSPVKYVRGPIFSLENTIVADFPNFC